MYFEYKYTFFMSSKIPTTFLNFHRHITQPLSHNTAFIGWGDTFKRARINEDLTDTSTLSPSTF